MTWASGVRRRGAAWLGAACVAGAWLSAGGCVSPPSVGPLLRATEGVIRAEAGRLRADGAGDAAEAAAVRRSLAEGFAADLRGRAVLDAAWVQEAADVYAAAREAVARHELEALASRERRAADLEAAAGATRRAAELLERQDALVTRVTRVDVWRLLIGAEGGER